MLEGLTGQSLSFPTLRHASADIVRVTWMSQGTHIAEAKPREKKFTVNYLPKFHGRLLIHPANLSLEIRDLMLEDSGTYDMVVDTSSNPTNPKTFSYLLLVHCESKDGGRRVAGTKLCWVHPGHIPLGLGCHCTSSLALRPPVPATSPLTVQRSLGQACGPWRNSPSSFGAHAHQLHPLHPAPVAHRPPPGAASIAPSPGGTQSHQGGDQSLKQPLATWLTPCPVHTDDLSETAAGSSDAGGHSGSTTRPQGMTEPHVRHAATQGAGGGQPPGSGGGTAACGVQSRYCVVKGYLMATIFVPLLVLVVTIHVMTRDKAAEPGDQVPVGLRVESEPPVITAAQGLSPQQ